MKIKVITVYYDLEEGRYYCESDYRSKFEAVLPKIECTARFVPIVKTVSRGW